MREFSQKTVWRCDRLVAWVYYAVIVGVVLAVVWASFRYALPFVLALAVALLLQRPLKWLVRVTRVSRPFFSVLLVLTVVLLLAGVVLVIGWQTVAFAADYFGDEATIGRWQAVLTDISDTLTAAVDRLACCMSPSAAQTWYGVVERFSESGMQWLTDWFTHMAGGMIGGLTRILPGLLIGIIVWVVASVLLTTEYDRIKALVCGFLPQRLTDMMGKVGTWGGRAIGKLVRAYALLLIITFAELSVGLWLLKIPHVLPIAAMIAVVDLLPILGVGTVLIPWGIILILSGQAGTGGGLLALYLVIAIVRHILEPRLVSRQLGLHPLVTLLSMYVGLQTIGLAGVLLFPLAALIVRQICRGNRLAILKEKEQP